MIRLHGITNTENKNNEHSLSY